MIKEFIQWRRDQREAKQQEFQARLDECQRLSEAVLRELTAGQKELEVSWNLEMYFDSSAITLNEEERKELVAALNGLTFVTQCQAFTWNASGWKPLELSTGPSPKPPRTPTPRGLDEYLWSSPEATDKSGLSPSAPPNGSALSPWKSDRPPGYWSNHWANTWISYRKEIY